MPCYGNCMRKQCETIARGTSRPGGCMRGQRTTPKLGRSPFMARLSIVVPTVLAQLTAALVARAEGSAQIGQIDPSFDGGLLAETVMLVDVLEGDTTLHVVARGSGNVNVTVGQLDADGSVTSSDTYTLTAAV